MKVRDLMIPLRDHLRPEMTLQQAVSLLQGVRRNQLPSGVKGLPVLDSHGKLVGMLSMTDILRAILPVYLSMTDLGEFTWDGMLESLARKAGARTVESVMTHDVLTVQEDDPVLECVDHIVKKNIRRLPVVDGRGQVIAMVYERDVFFAITKAMQGAEGGSGTV
jgi:CBS domain-containing protein